MATFFRIVAVALVVGCTPLTDKAVGKDIRFADIERGKYLVDASDCMSCHTPDKNKPFAGGGPLETPFGTIYSSNITPDKETGIGAWSDDAFYNAMHFGIDPAGNRLYPAFPYPYFTHMTRDDVDAIRTYLNTLEPIRNTPPVNKLMWPLNHRVFMRGWNWLYFDAGTFTPNPGKSPEWNRGAYLVEGPGHCGACHTGKNMFGADKTTSGYLKGGVLENWFAPKLINDASGGIASWTTDDIVTYLKTGRNAKSGAAGLMAEVVEYSTSHLNDEDLLAIATYLKNLPGSEKILAPTRIDDAVLIAGKGIYDASCGACHKSNGEGVPFMFPPLKGNANVQADDATTVIRVILEGARTVATAQEPTPSAMPSYDWKLPDDEIAAVASYIRNAWGNAGSAISPNQVQTLRGKLSEASAGH